MRHKISVKSIIYISHLMCSTHNLINTFFWFTHIHSRFFVLEIFHDNTLIDVNHCRKCFFKVLIPVCRIYHLRITAIPIWCHIAVFIVPIINYTLLEAINKPKRYYPEFITNYGSELLLAQNTSSIDRTSDIVVSLTPPSCIQKPF